MKDSGDSTLHFLDYWRIIRMRWALVLIIFLLCVCSAGVACYYMPREYFARVNLSVKPDEADLKIFGSTRTQPDTAWRPANAFQVLQSKAVLYPVIDELGLQAKWSAELGQQLTKEDTYNFVKRKMRSSGEIRHTDFLHISVYSTSSTEAAELANAIAKSFKHVREKEQAEKMERNLGELQEQVRQKEVTEQEALQKLNDIRVREGIIDLNPEVIENVATHEQDTMRQDETQVNEAKLRVAHLTSQIEQVANLNPSELLNALTTLDINDPMIAKLQPLYQELMVEETRLLNSGLGENHPKVRSVRAQRNQYGEQLAAQVNTLKTSLNARLKVAQATLESLEEKLKTTHDKYLASRAQNFEYLNQKSQYIQAKRILDSAKASLSTQQMQLGISIHPVTIWDHAEPSNRIAKPNVLAYMSIAVGIGLIFGIGLAFFMEYLDTSVKTLEEAEDALDVPVLAVIPKNVPKLALDDRDLPEAEAYRILQTNLEFLRKDGLGKTLTVVSGGLGEGKSTTLNNLAVIYARSGYRVLVVDADFRRSSQHTFFKLPNERGLIDVLQGNLAFEQAVQQTQVENLQLLTSGKLNHNALGILNSPQTSEFIRDIKTRYDIVFFDSPPILGLSDASILARDMDLTLMVIQYRRFPVSMLQRVKQTVLQVGGRMVGVILNNVDTRRDGNYQYYSQYYDYYRGTYEKGQTAAAAAPASVAAGSDSKTDSSDSRGRSSDY